MIVMIAGLLTAVVVLLLSFGWRQRKRENNWFYVRHSERAKPVRPTKEEPVDLITAGLSLSSEHKLIIAGLCAALGFVFVHALTGRADLAVIGLGAAFIGPRAWSGWRVEARRRLFDQQLQGSLDQMAAALKAGANLPQAWEQAALNAPSPAQEVLGYVVGQVHNAGYTLADALEELDKRVKSNDLRLITVATTLCAETGGDIAGVYQRLAQEMRDRETFKAHAKALMTEGSMSANVLLVLPFGTILLFRFLSPEYMAPLFHSGTGLVVFGIASGMIVAGWLVVRSMMRLEL